MSVKHDILILLILFYAIFVLGDVLTTFWLIKFYPGGISGEMNPLAYLIFTKYGYLGMLMSKITVFIVFSIVFIFLYRRYYDILWFREALEIIILGLSGLSTLVIINNTFSIIVTSYLIYGESPIWLLKILVFLLSVVIVELGALIVFRDPIRGVEAIFGCLLALAPLFFWPVLEPILYIAYLVLLFVLLASSLYFIEYIKKE